MTRPTTWLTAALISLLLGSAHLLDGPSDIEAAQDTASAAADAAHAAKTQAHFERAASRACGASGGFALVDSNTVQCITPHGRQTITAKVAL
jgi:hypothetical protein